MSTINPSSLQALLSDPNLVSIDEASDLAGVGRATMYRWSAQVPGLALKLSEGVPGKGIVLVYRDQLDRFCAARQLVMTGRRMRKHAVGRVGQELAAA